MAWLLLRQAPPRSPPQAGGKTSPPAKFLCKPAAPSPAKERSDWAGEGYKGGQTLSGQGCKTDERCFKRWFSRPTLVVTLNKERFFLPQYTKKVSEFYMIWVKFWRLRTTHRPGVYLARAGYLGPMRRAPSRRMTSPLSMTFSMMWATRKAYSGG